MVRDWLKAARLQQEAPIRRSQRPECLAYASDLDAQPRAMRFIGIALPEGMHDQRFA
jgi:hypothetical protein